MGFLASRLPDVTAPNLSLSGHAMTLLSSRRGVSHRCGIIFDSKRNTTQKLEHVAPTELRPGLLWWDYKHRAPDGAEWRRAIVRTSVHSRIARSDKAATI